jgi:hypothetical protein
MLGALVGCKKLVSIPEPVNTITTSETFSSDGNATSAVVAIYNDMISGDGQQLAYANGETTCFMGNSADELLYYDNTNVLMMEIQNNAINANDNGYIDNYLWIPAFYDLYMANGAVAGLEGNTVITPSLQKQLLGEAKFLRAFCNFYLLNTFGNIPLVTTTAWAQTSLLPQASASQVYQLITQDLQDAEGLLASDYSYSNGERTRANKWAAAALLARVYLYNKNYTGADSAASAVIGNNSMYSLVTDPNGVFLANSQEAIWQLVPNAITLYATPEGYWNIPYPDSNGTPVYYITPTLMNAFDSGDLRQTDWLDSTNYNGSVYYYPYKYKVQQGAQGSVPEYYMVLRLAEQLLIRAEANAQPGGNNLAQAITDINTIRSRAGLGPTTATTQPQVFAAIQHERQVELFAEWGNRWLDLQRWGTATTVLTADKGFSVPSYQLIYPIPPGEITVDPNLHQNPGY